MKEMVTEMLRFLAESFYTYTGGNKIWLLYPVAQIVIFLFGKKEDKKLFAGVWILEALTIFNPLLIKLFLELFGFGNRYLRLFWMVLLFVTVAYAVNLVIFRWKKPICRFAAGAVCVALIVGLGNPVFWGKDVYPYIPAENEYFTETDLLGLASILHSEGKEKPRVLYGRIMLSYCQFDPAVRSVISRKTLLDLESHTMEDFLNLDGYTDTMKNICRVYYYGDYSIPTDTFYKCVRKAKLNYVVSASAELDAYLQGTKMTILGTSGKYSVWKVL
ncbi:MAG: hypothetical protein Q4C77_03340 [Eubacteriales bacterium]|nr:hypothetical protein [Eubacteriales bacterium]